MNMKPLFCAPLLTSMLVACSSPSDPGGFSGTPAPTPSPTPTPTPTPTPLPTAEGLWTGTTNTARTVTGLVLDNGTFYFLYSPPNQPLRIGGVVQGTGTSSNGAFTSNDARDFSVEGAGTLPATVAGNYVARQTLGGNITYIPTSNTVAFNTTFDSTYDITPTLVVVAGVYAGQLGNSQGVETAALTISPTTGAISGSSNSGCTFSGTVAPRASGNVYDASIVFGPAPCFFANQTLSGIAYYKASVRALYVTAPNAGRTDSVLFVGVKS